MKITLDILKENGANTDILDYFATTFGEDKEIDAYELIDQIHKDKKNFSRWLYETFGLSGFCETFYENGK